jgi:hypothetical protein
MNAGGAMRTVEPANLLPHEPMWRVSDLTVRYGRKTALSSYPWIFERCRNHASGRQDVAKAPSLLLNRHGLP